MPQTISSGAGAVVPPEDSPIKDLWLEPPVAAPGQEFTLFVDSTTVPQRASDNPGAGGTWTDMTLVGDVNEEGLRRYKWTTTAPTFDNVLTAKPYYVRAPYPSSGTSPGPGGGAAFSGVTLDPAAYLLIRRTTAPILDMHLYKPGSAVPKYVASPNDTIRVSVEVNELYYGQQYVMKLDPGAGELGQFYPIYLPSIRRSPYYLPTDPLAYEILLGEDAQSAYMNALREPFPYEIEIGDSVWVEPGSMGGLASEQNLDYRFDGDDRTWDQWQADLVDGDPSNDASKRIVLVPVMEKMTTTGTPLRVVSLAMFYVEPQTRLQMNEIVGRFIEYVTPSENIVEDPTGEFAIRTVRLAPPLDPPPAMDQLFAMLP